MREREGEREVGGGGGGADSQVSSIFIDSSNEQSCSKRATLQKREQEKLTSYRQNPILVLQ